MSNIEKGENISPEDPNVELTRRQLIESCAQLGAAGIVGGVSGEAAINLLARANQVDEALRRLAQLRERGQKLDAKSQSSSDTNPLAQSIQHDQLTSTSETKTFQRRTEDEIASILQINPVSSDLSPEEIATWVKDHFGHTIIGTIIGTVGGLYIKYRYDKWKRRHDIEVAEQQAQRQQERIDNQRFQNAVNTLANPELYAKAAAATQLLTFLREPGKERFHQDIFQIAVNHFRSREIDLDNLQPNAADQAFVPVFIESASRVRERLEKDGKEITLDVARRFLDASDTHFDGTDLTLAQLSYIYMPRSTFLKTVLDRAKLQNANFEGADFSWAEITFADCSKTNLNDVDLHFADLTGAVLKEADLSFTQLLYAKLAHAKLDAANLYFADLTGANLSYANLNLANLTFANLKSTNLSFAKSLKGTNMYEAKGLTPELVQKYLEMGAIFERPKTLLEQYFPNNLNKESE